MVLSDHPNNAESGGEEMLRVSLNDLMKTRAIARQQYKELGQYIKALDILIKRQQRPGVEGLEAFHVLSVEAEKCTKREMMRQIVERKGRAKPKEVLGALRRRGIIITAHYVHNELSALYKTRVLDRENGEYFLRVEKENAKKKARK